MDWQKLFLLFKLNASYNETAYKVDVYKNVGGTSVLAISTGWTNGEATSFCFTTDNSWIGANYLRPNTPYKVILTVKNACDEEALTLVEFTTGTSKCEAEPGGDEKLRVSPNPSSGDATVKFDLEEAEHYMLYRSNMLSGPVLLKNEMGIQGENTVTLNSNSWPQGTYSLTLVKSQTVHTINFIKL